MPVTALAWGVLIAGVVQLLFQLPFLYREGLLPRPRWGWRHEGVQKIIKLMIPALFGSSVAQINLLFDTFIASFLMTGSVSWLYYSDRLLEFPLGVFGIALATVVLPNLSEAHYKQAPGSHFQRHAELGDPAVADHRGAGHLRPVPAGAADPRHAVPVRCLHCQRLVMAAYSLMAYSLGLPAFILIKILANGFYARQDTKTPVRIGIQAMMFNMLLNVVFVLAMLQAGRLHRTSVWRWRPALRPISTPASPGAGAARDEILERHHFRSAAAEGPAAPVSRWAQC